MNPCPYCGAAWVEEDCGHPRYTCGTLSHNRSPECEVKAPAAKCATCKHLTEDPEFEKVFHCGHPHFSTLCWQWGHAEGPICVEPDFGCVLHSPNTKDEPRPQRQDETNQL